jgi:HEAT repeat protein
MGLFGSGRLNIEKLEKKQAVQKLINAYASINNYDIKCEIIEALARIKDEQAIQQLISSLQESVWQLRDCAERVLIEMKDERIIQPLIAALNYDNWRIRSSAAKILGGIKDRRAIEPLIASLNDEKSEVKRLAIEALIKFKDSRSLEALIKSLSDKNRLVRNNAIKALGAINDVRAIEPLVEMLRDIDKQVRKNASNVLESMKWKPQNKIDKAEFLHAKGDPYPNDTEIKTLMVIAEMRDSDPKTRKSSALKLEKTKTSQAIEALINLLDDENPDVRWNAAWTLGMIKDHRAIIPMIKALDEETVAGKMIVMAILNINEFKAYDDYDALPTVLRKIIKDSGVDVENIGKIIEEIKDDSYCKLAYDYDEEFTGYPNYYAPKE